MSEKEGAHDYTPEHPEDAQESKGSPRNPARATGLCGGGVCLPGGGLGQERAPWGCSTSLPRVSTGDLWEPPRHSAWGTPPRPRAQAQGLTRSRKPSGQVNWSYQMALYMIRTQPMSAMAKAIMRAVGSWGWEEGGARCGGGTEPGLGLGALGEVRT